MSKLITFGCSHTQGYYYISGPGAISNYNKYYDYHNREFPPTWPMILADKLGLKLLNLGKGGIGNDSIFRTFGLNIDKIEKGDTVVYQIGQNIRIPFAADGCMLDLLVGTNKDHWNSEDIPFEHARSFFLNRDSDQWTKIVLLAYVKVVDSIVRSKGANLWFWGDDSTVTATIPSVEELWSIIGVHRWIKKPGESLLAYLSSEYNDARIKQETKGLIDDSHMGKYGHELQASYMYNFIEQYEHLQPNLHREIH